MWDLACEYLYGRNLYVDTSSTLWVIEPEKALKYIKMHGVHKVLFGTDYPMSSHKEELARFDKLDLTDEEKNLILFENVRKLLNI